MTHASSLDTILVALGALSVTDVVVCTLQTMPMSASPGTHYLIPSPVDPNFMTGFRTENVSFGQKTAEMDAYYRLNYKLLYTPVGAGRDLTDILPEMFDMALAVFVAILELDAITGAVSWDVTLGENMQVVDAAGTSWHAMPVMVDIHEFIQ